MGAQLGNGAAGNHGNLIGVADGGQAMRHHHSDAIGEHGLRAWVMSASVSESMVAVASSRITSSALHSSTRVRDRSWRCPADKRLPLLPPQRQALGRARTKAAPWLVSSAAQSSASEAPGFAKRRLSATVPEKTWAC